MKKILMLIFAAVMLAMAAACGGGGEKASNDDDVQTLKWYLMFQDQKDFPEVLQKINEITTKEIGAKVDIQRLDPTTYLEKMKLIIASRENFDIFFTSPDYQYYSFANKGALMDITELVKEYAPQSYAQIPEEYWEAAKIDGKIYGFINYQIVGRQNGFVIQKEMTDKYNFDPASVTNFYDLEPLLEQIKANEPATTVPIYISKSAPTCMMSGEGIKEVTSSIVGGIVEDGNMDDYTVFNIYEHPKFKEGVELMRKWYLAGYIEADAATITNARERLGKGQTMMWYDMVGPGFEPSFEAMIGGKEVVTTITEQPFITGSSIIATMQGISATSKNPEKAMQLLELVNTNKDDIYNLMCFGIEGKHYNKISDTRIELIPDSGYYPNMAWEFGNQFNAYLIEGQEDGLWEETKALNERAQRSKLIGFVFDTDPVKTEIGQCTAVLDEYLPSLGTGSVDPESKLPEFLDKLKSAGADNIIQELQRQIDEWVSSNKN